MLRLLTLFRVKVGGQVTPVFFLQISSSWVKLRLPSKNHLPGLPVSASKVCGGVSTAYMGVSTAYMVGNKVIMWSIKLELS